MPSARHAVCAAAVSAMLWGCHESPFPDDAGAMYDLSCAARPAPVAATPDIAILGTVEEVLPDPNGQGPPVVQPASNATIETCTVGVDPCTMDGSATSQLDGSFGIAPHSTGAVPYDVYLRANHYADAPAFVFPSSPLTMDQRLDVVLISGAFVQQLPAYGIQVDMSKAIVGVQVLDCAGMPIVDTDHLQISVRQNGAPIPGVSVVDAAPFGPAFAGVSFVLGVPPGQIDVAATYRGTPLRAHTVTTYASSMTETQLRPGY